MFYNSNNFYNKFDSKSNECPRCADCLTLPLWQGLERVINEYLDGVSLRDVIDGNIK